jgi:glycosyltransferase involved in cell wall biosynthesis
LLYVSILDVYKHQEQVVQAVALLRQEGLPVKLDLVGPAYPPVLSRLTAMLRQLDPQGNFINYAGPLPYAEMPGVNRDADGFVFASSCENMPNILLEAMASGLPIACSGRGPMPEVLGEAGVYFDPEDPTSIAAALRELLSSPELRARWAQAAYQRARGFSWEQCAQQTLEFLAQVASGAGR